MALRRRGWVEKFHNSPSPAELENRKKTSPSQSNDERYDDCKLIIFKYNFYCKYDLICQFKCGKCAFDCLFILIKADDKQNKVKRKEKPWEEENGYYGLMVIYNYDFNECLCCCLYFMLTWLQSNVLHIFPYMHTYSLLIFMRITATVVNSEY